MYETRPNLILGFHGCDKSVALDLLQNPDKIKVKRNNYDWLGHGMYFWENNYARALQWAKEKKKRKEIEEPAVIGAVLSLGNCCDFLDSEFLDLLKLYFELIKAYYKQAGLELPVNKDIIHDSHKDKILRELDCTVIEFMHLQIYQRIKKDIATFNYSEHHNFDSTRGVFTEGGPLYEGAGLSAKSHIQVCVRNFNCVKGFFLPRKDEDFVLKLEKSYFMPTS